MNIKELKIKLSSTEHWYIRLLQWPFVTIFYSFLAVFAPLCCIGIIIIWPFYDVENNK